MRRPAGSLKLMVTDRLPLFRLVQYRLVPDGASGQRFRSAPPPTGSILITSAPSWARVRPPSGAATKLEISRTVRPSSGRDSLTGTTGPAVPAAGSGRSSGRD